MFSGLAEESGLVQNARRCVLLAGVYGDGVQALARILVHLGVYQDGDASRFQEQLHDLNKAVLESAGFDEGSIEPFHEGWYSSLRHAEFHERAVELVRSTYSSSSLFVLHDNAIGRLVPFWRNVLLTCGIEPVVLDFYEDPASYASGLLQSAGFGGPAAYAVWLARVIECEQASRGLVRAHLSQEVLSEDWEAAVARVSEATGVTWPAWSARVRKSIHVELGRGGRGEAEVPAQVILQADQLGLWVHAAQDIISRWAREGEDDRGRIQMDEVRQSFDQAREFVAIALAAVADMGDELRSQRQAAEALLSQLLDLQRKWEAMEEGTRLQASEIDALRQTLAALENERDRLSPLPEKDRGELAKIEAKWAEAFRFSRDTAEILTEQNGVFQAAIERLTVEVSELETRLGVALSEVDRLRVVEIAQKGETASARAEVADIRKSLDPVQKSLAEARERESSLRAEAVSREATIENLQNELMARAGSTGGGTQFSLEALKAGLSPKYLFSYFKPKARKKMLRHRQLRGLVSASGMFDPQFYASRYPDVVAAGEDLLDHFISFGGAEGRHPSPSFNSKWYLSEYPDIRSAGLNPLVHYLEHGRDEGRRRRSLFGGPAEPTANSQAFAAPASASQALDKQYSPPPELRAEVSELEGAWRPKTSGWRAMLSPNSATRPAIVPLKELEGQPNARAIAVGIDVVACLASDTPEHALDRIALFAAMRMENAAAVTVASVQAAVSASHVLLTSSGCGLGSIADAWYDSQSSLTLRLSRGFIGLARVFQVDGNDRLQCVAEAALGGGEADLVEVKLIDPLGPLLMVLSKSDGSLVDSAVVPFPSLLRGGVHYGELAVLEAAPGSMATLAEYSHALALEWLGWAEGPDGFAIERIEIDMRGASGTEPIYRPALLTSIARHFGVAVRARDGSYPPQRAQLVSMIESIEPASRPGARAAAGAKLVVPSDCIPSIYALVSRHFPHDLAMTRFAVVDAATGRPHADVSLPFDENLARLQHGEMPAHAPFLLSSGEGATGIGGSTFPLAVRHYNRLAWAVDPLIPVSPDQDMPTGPISGIGKTVTVIIDFPRDEEALVNCLSALENQIGAERLDVIVTGWPDNEPLPPCALPVRSINGIDLTVAGRLNAAAKISEAAWLIFLDPGVLVSDPRTIAVLSHLADRPGTASAACALVTEFHDDDEASVHSAGYFPTRVSLLGEPVFDFDQVDIARAMPAATFPVVANHAKCVLYDAAIFRALGGFDAQRFPMAMHDLDLGVRALAAGHTNLCTTLVRAAVDEAAPSADFPNPLAHRSVRPADWQSLLDRVTVVMELRR
ncbi:hypothetical protein [Erythrobacter sp. R86502]|uniref:hypothetical protein n=1 Tax=Erythrobacter sp. R86502 TaxID=3093846 RepID=UPI0036D281B7